MNKPPERTLDTANAVGEGARDGWMVRPGQRFADRLQLLTLLRQRFQEDRLGMTAGSLTFTTLIALVPLLTVTLALFTAFPMFSTFQGSLERLFLQNLVPDTILRC